MTTNSNDSDELAYTGERYVPNVQGEIALEHWHRYLLAREFAARRTVLDIACGEGYGSALLSEVAQSVIGVDISAETIAHAARRYRHPNVDFRVGSCAVVPVPDSAVDLVVSFETIEHHSEHDQMLREIKRVLRPGGLLILSSPDRPEFRRLFGEPTKDSFHVKELDRGEFEDLIKKHFGNVAILGQRVLFGSGIFLEGSSGRLVVNELSEQASDTPQRSEGMPHPVYLIAIASDEALPVLNNSFYSKRIGPAEIELIWPSGIMEMFRESQRVAKAADE